MSSIYQVDWWDSTDGYVNLFLPILLFDCCDMSQAFIAWVRVKRVRLYRGYPHVNHAACVTLELKAWATFWVRFSRVLNYMYIVHSIPHCPAECTLVKYSCNSNTLLSLLSAYLVLNNHDINKLQSQFFASYLCYCRVTKLAWFKYALKHL